MEQNHLHLEMILVRPWEPSERTATKAVAVEKVNTEVVTLAVYRVDQIA
jgi:hypothetical protein